MVSFIVRFTFAPKIALKWQRALRLLTAASRLEPGCVSYIPHHVEGDPDTIVIYEQYRDEKALAAHRESAALQEIRRWRALPEDEESQSREPGCSRLRPLLSPIGGMPGLETGNVSREFQSRGDVPS